MNKMNDEVITNKYVIKLLHEVIVQNILTYWDLFDCKVYIHPNSANYRNIFYFVSKKDKEYVLRISVREDISVSNLNAEMHFIEYLKLNKLSVGYPIKSKKSSFVESIKFENLTLNCVLFSRVKGVNIPENNILNLKGTAFDEYVHSFGKIIGLMHRLTTQYTPFNNFTKRYDLLKSFEDDLILKHLPDQHTAIKQKFLSLIKETKSLPKDTKCFGLIHTDIDDSNIIINNYTNSHTIIDFDDSAYCWFMYDIANAWTKGLIWAQFDRTIDKRKAKMNEWIDKIMGGYNTENVLIKYWLSKLELFLKIVEMKEFICLFQRAKENNQIVEYDSKLKYRIECIENDIPYFGFFHEIYDPFTPFC